MAIALDTTAHPTNAGNLLGNQDGAGAHVWQTISVGTFSTGSGPVIIRAHVNADGSALPFGGSAGVAWSGGTPSGWSAFTKRIDNTSVGHDFGVQVWTAFSASTALTNGTVVFTANTNSANQSGSLWLLVENGVAATEAACTGNNGGYIDESGGTHTVAASITPAATGSSLAGIYLNTNVHTALTANAQTSAFDAHHEFTGSDAVAFGRYKVSGTVTLSTAGVAKSLGATDTDAFTAVAVLEIQAPASGTPLAGVMAGSGVSSGTLTAAIALAGKMAGSGAATANQVGAVALAGVLAGAGAASATLRESIALATSASGASTATGRAALPAFPISVHSSGRYLVDRNGTPFPIFGDSAWEAVHNLTATEQIILINDRCLKGFTATLFPVIEHKFTSSKPPKDLAGNLPFTKRLDGTSWTGSPNGTTGPGLSGNGVSSNTGGNTYAADPYVTIGNESPDLTFPNSTYWATIDSWVSLCAANGILCFVYPAYYGFNANDEGWNAEMVANDAITGAGGQVGQPFADVSKSKLWNYGAWLADRYKAFGNIVWILGGDSGLNGTSGAGTFSTAQSNAVLHVYQGMHSVAGQASTNWTGHWGRNTLASDISADATNGTALAAAMTLESTYPNTDSAQQGRAGYANSPAQPVFDIEDTYEGDESPANRRLHWWEMLTGIAGYFWSAGIGTTGTPGSIAYWGFPTGWQAQLATAGTADTARLNAFFTSIPWWKLVPAGLSGMKTLVTSGGGTASPQSTDYVSAAATVAGDLLLAYRPPAHSGTITIDMTAMGGPTRSRWFDPTAGTYSADATNLANTGTHAFTVPGNNAAGATDWTLVLDAAPLAGSTSGVSALSGALQEAIALKAIFSGASAVSSNLGLGLPLALAGVMAGSSASAGTLAVSVALAGATSGQGVLAGALSEAVQLAARAAGGAAVAGSLSVGTPLALAGVMGGAGATSGALSLAIGLASAVSGASASAGAIGLSVGLAASASGASAGSGILSLAVRLAGLAVGGGAARPSLTLGLPVTLARGVVLRGQPTQFATLSGKSGFPTLNGQGDS